MDTNNPVDPQRFQCSLDHYDAKLKANHGHISLIQDNVVDSEARIHSPNKRVFGHIDLGQVVWKPCLSHGFAFQASADPTLTSEDDDLNRALGLCLVAIDLSDDSEHALSVIAMHGYLASLKNMDEISRDDKLCLVQTMNFIIENAQCSDDALEAQNVLRALRALVSV